MLQAHPWLNDLRIEVTPQVAENLAENGSRSSAIVTDHHWWSPRAWLAPNQRIHQLQMTVFGPRYGRRRARTTVTGIADVTSVYAWPDGLAPGPISARLKRAARGWISRQIFSNENVLVSESPSLMRSFNQRMKYDPRRTRIIPNTANRAITDSELLQPFEWDLRAGIPPQTVLFAYVARKYSHKNHEFLPALRDELGALGTDCRFVVTFTKDEWASSTDTFRHACINAGIVPISMIANLNQQCTAAIFPSLLESFSATPLEALCANGLLFASDRPFVRDVCGDAAVYFDPLDAHGSAAVISAVLGSDSQIRAYRQAAARKARTLTSAPERARQYIELITELLNQAGDQPLRETSHEDTCPY